MRSDMTKDNNYLVQVSVAFALDDVFFTKAKSIKELEERFNGGGGDTQLIQATKVHIKKGLN